MNMNADTFNSAYNYKLFFNTLAYAWLDTKKSTIKYSSYVKYLNIIEKHLIPEFSDMELSSINSMRINSFISKLQTEKNQNGVIYSSSTVSDIVFVLKEIFQYAENNSNIKITIPDFSIKKKGANIPVLTEEEQQLLSEYLRLNISRKNLGILVSLYMGLRIGEVCALTWSNISLSNNTIHVNKTMQRVKKTDHTNGEKTFISITEPKSVSSDRIIPIPSKLITYFTEYQADNNAYLLTGLEERFIEPRNMQYHFKKILADCKLQPIKFHSLRHSFATRCIEVGFDVKSLSEILGHSNISITMNRYVHPSMELKREHMEKLIR